MVPVARAPDSRADASREPCISVFARSAPLKFAPVRSTWWNVAWRSVARVRLAPARDNRGRLRRVPAWASLADDPPFQLRPGQLDSRKGLVGCPCSAARRA